MEKIAWPSERVQHGGIFHQRNVNYSQETHDMIRSLMNEAKLTMMQRNKINYFLRQGSALPQLEMQRRKLPSEEYEMRRAREIMDRSRVVRKRSYETIVKSGIFEVEKYVPKVISRNNEKVKQQLQERMSGMKEYPELDKIELKTTDKHRKNGNRFYSNDRIAELLKEIYERIEWLKEMNELGEGKKHRQVIDAQVTERLREIKSIEEKLAKEKRDGLQNES
ncbi:hypothetical protein PVAND_002292 [Polypedilum vanderplanki]|uniref:Uncharacterized protein n=1 Tax=Polypedilum vanderplanki TaxID=319348 RepID=A0A9J6BQW3_POLVA|nr:hypothetical protein PVAND_002292 [Polypedilum vanderplanki]